MTDRISPSLRSLRGPVSLGLISLLSTTATAMPQAELRGGEVAELLDGRRETGRLIASEEDSFAFAPDSGAEPIPIDRLGLLERSTEGGAPGPMPEPSPFILSLGLGERVSGRLVDLDEKTVRFSLGPDGPELVADRRGLSSMVQRPGEAHVDSEAFDEQEPAPDRWELVLGAGVGPGLDESGSCLVLDPAGAEARFLPPEPIDAGRVELSFDWEERQFPGLRWYVDFVFDGPNGEEITRAVLGWADPFPSIESRGGPEVVVQPLVLDPGWHRLSARFGPDRTLLVIDGDELGRGGGVKGPLVALRLFAETSPDAEPANDLKARVDDVLIVRSFEPTTSTDVDPLQDEARLVSGDQIWGDLSSADGDGVSLLVLDRPFGLPWSQVAGLYFRREPRQSEAIEGPLVRVDWEAGDPESQADRIEGALVGLDDETVRVITPYAGTVPVPRDRLRRLEVLGRGRRLVLDPHPRHLGDQLMPELDPPMPDGDRHELAFTLDGLPDGPAELVVDAIQVEGEYDGGRFVEDLRAGFLKTTIALNGEAFDDLNRHVRDPNRSPAQLQIPIPAGRLREGENTITFQQLGREKETDYRDDLGLLRVALEWPEGVGEQP